MTAATPPRPARPFFLITIDCEADNLWARSPRATTENALHLPRFQELCERHGLIPTYLTDYDMAGDPRFLTFATAATGRGTAEIGMHLHAWNTPPLNPLTDDDARHHPFAIEYPPDTIRTKVDFITTYLADRIGARPVSHRSGRWSLNELYARILAEACYRVDCSVVPNISYRRHRGRGDSEQREGPDYRGFPEEPYYLDLQDIRRPGSSALLEVPMTVVRTFPRVDRWLSAFGRDGVLRTLFDRAVRGTRWLRPNGQNLRHMQWILDYSLRKGRTYVEFMLHSSEFMPAGSPRFPDAESIERLYGHLDILFRRASQDFQPASLSQFAQWFESKNVKPVYDFSNPCPKKP